jgi:hypothetical protein
MNKGGLFAKGDPRRDWLNRRNFIRTSVGVAGSGLVLGSGPRLPLLAQEAAHPSCPDLPRPIPHITSPPGQHFFFPGPVTGPADPSTITDFKGMIGQADLFFTGTGTKLDTGESAPYGFHTDWRFMSGVFVGVDGLAHNGTLTFI